MPINYINMNDILKELKLNNRSTYLNIQGEIDNTNMSLDEYFKEINELSVPERFELFLSTIGYSFKKNNLYTSMIELTKIIPFIQPNYNLMLMGQQALGKSSIYSLVMPFHNRFSGLPTEAKLRGTEKGETVDALLDNNLLILEEIADNDSPNNSISLLKDFLSSGKFLKGNKTEISSECSTVFIFNNYLSVNSNNDLKINNLTSSLPNKIKDEAFFSRFNGFLPHYENLFANKYYSDSKKGIHCQYFNGILLKLRTIKNKKFYLNSDKKFDERVAGNINSTINGFVKLIFGIQEPSEDFLNFITSWAEYIVSFNTPFKKNSIPFIKQLYFKDSDIESGLFLSNNRILFKFLEHENIPIFKIFPLNGFGIKENQYDFELSTKISDETIPEFKLNDGILSFSLDADIPSNKVLYFNKENHSLNDDSFNDLLLDYTSICAKIGIPLSSNFSFRGVPNFYHNIIENKAKSIFENKAKKLSKTSYLITKDGFKFINYFNISN